MSVISVSIQINGYPIMARSAVNKGTVKDGKTKYQVDDGTIVWHDPLDGAVPLAVQLLQTIKDVDK